MYCNYHKHTHYSNISTLDCVVKPEEYMIRAVELGHTEYFTTEHGYQGNIFDVYTLCQKYNLKCIYAAELYYVDNRYEKDKGNYHLVVIAMNENGRKQINKIISEANETGYYYKARVDKELVLSLNPNDVIITTACVASRLFKGDNWLEEFFLPMYEHFGKSMYLEVQNHNEDIQKKHNKMVLELSDKYGLGIIHANDSHYIKSEDAQYRKLFLKAKGVVYGDEDAFILDYPDEKTIIQRYREQGILSDKQIFQALDNTLIFKQSTGIIIDKEFKIPKVTAYNEDSDKVLAKIINESWKKERVNIPKEEHAKYIKEIRYEYDMIKKCGMSDYFIIDYKIAKKAIEEYNGILTHTGRGSGVSFYINKLLGLTEIDRIWCPVKLYPTRFMSDTRILESRSLPDIDQNWADVTAPIKASQDYLGIDGIRQMVSFKPMQVSSAFRLWCKAKDLNINEYDEVAKKLRDDEHCLDNDEKWSTLIEESKVFRGVIESIAPSPCSYLLLDKPISEEIGLISIGSGNDRVVCCVLDGYNCDYYKYLKNDYLIVTVWDIISKVYEKIGSPIDDIKTLISKCDDKVWDLFSNCITATINQCDTDFGKQTLKVYKPRTIEELSAYVAAIRPGFANNLETFKNRETYSTGVPELDELLKDSFSYIMYQESIMSYLVWLGIPEKDSYDIIKKISKKKFKEDELKNLKDKLSKGWLNKIGNLDMFEKTWSDIENSSRYSFNASHSVSVALDALYGAYLKANYPMEYYSVVFEIYSDDINKTRDLTDELPYFNIKLKLPKFRISNNHYTCDKRNNVIYKNIQSIKFLNETIAEQLYGMRDMQFNSFLDFLKVNPCNSKQTEILIKLDFFSEFGKTGKLMDIYNFYQTRYDKNKFKKQIKKDKNPYSIDIISKYSKETEKQYVIIDEEGFCNDIISSFEDKEISIKERLDAQIEYLGYIEYKNDKAKDYGYIIDVNTKYTPRFTIYKIDTGETISVKYSKRDYEQSDLDKGKIIKFVTTEKPRKKLIDGHWVDLEESELWIKSYKIFQ